MQRESPRLKDNGYYSLRNAPQDQGAPRICYREIPIRKRKRSQVFQVQAATQVPPPLPTQCLQTTELIPEGQSCSHGVMKVLTTLLLTILILILISACVWFFFPLFNSVKLVRLLRSIFTNKHAENTNMLKYSDTVAAQLPELRLTPELQQAIKELVRKLVQEHATLDRRDGSACCRHATDSLPNYALESQGASVIFSRCSETYPDVSTFLTLFGFQLWSIKSSPHVVIQGTRPLPGECWSFSGSEGRLAIALSHPVKITQVTLEHIPSSISPTGHINSAPKDFEVHGITAFPEKVFLGRFTYDRSGESVQTFVLQEPHPEAFPTVELHVLTNWGQEEYTCLYRVRVHGHLVPAPQ